MDSGRNTAFGLSRHTRNVMTSAVESACAFGMATWSFSISPKSGGVQHQARLVGERRLAVGAVGGENYRTSDVLDTLTVLFRFNKPAPGFLKGSSLIPSCLVSPATLSRSLDALGDATKIVGSGPFFA